MDRTEKTRNAGFLLPGNHRSELRAVREPGGDIFIEGYFAVFGGIYEIWPGATESVDPHAFDDTIGDDVRCLINHDTTLVLGRTEAGTKPKPGTLELKIDSIGLWFRCKINPDDTDAMNLVARMERGDVDQCSFGFEIFDELTEWREDGTVHWTLMKVKLYEGSIVTFPAYEDTSAVVSSRKRDYENIKNRANQTWTARMKERLSKHGR